MNPNYKLFVRKWLHPSYGPTVHSPAQVKSIEEAFDTQLPDSYKKFLTTVGSLSPTIALLDAVCDQKLDVHDLSELFAPTAVIKNTRLYQKGGMDRSLICIGNDCMGNMFCLNIEDMGSIYFFDHDFGTVDKLHSSFDDWLNELAKIEVNP